MQGRWNAPFLGSEENINNLLLLLEYGSGMRIGLADKIDWKKGGEYMKV
jgi:hypothetical protein